jgi:Fe-S cluster assembly ATPase SufC
MESLDVLLEKYNDWMVTHYEELVKEYPHKAIAVVEGEVVAVGKTEREVYEVARRKYPDTIPFVTTLPSEEDFVCLL